MVQVIVAAVTAIVFVFLMMLYSGGAFCRDQLCRDEWQAKIDASKRPYSPTPSVPAVAPAPAPPRVDQPVEVAGYQNRRHGHSGHRGHDAPKHTCPSGTRYDAEARICKGQPYTVERPRPPGEGWTRYDHGPLENGWMRRKCVANC